MEIQRKYVAGEDKESIQVLSSAFKGALKSAALDIPGSSKAQIGRLTWVEGERISIYGLPELFMSVTRSADIARTPDVRTRCIMREWACEVAVTFIFPTLKQNSIANLMAAAGLMSGIGDWRPGKGAGSYGQFEIVAEDDVRWNRIVNDYGRDVQLEAMANPVPYDDETQKLLGWFDGEAKARGFEVVA